MNADLKLAFSRIKPVCDLVMVCPSPEAIANFVSRVSDLKKEVVQELQQYLLFPFITHIKSTENDKKYELQWRLVDGMRVVLEKVTVNSYEMCMKIETSLLQLVFDNGKPGMIAEVPEELKHSVMKCLTALMLNIEKRFREQLLKMQVPLLAQAVFVSVHLAKLEKLRALRLAAINCVTAHTMTHPQLTNAKYCIPDASLEGQVVEMLSSILPGVLAALQDVATCSENPGHAVVVASVEAIHRILCLTMGDRFLSQKPNISAADFAKSFRDTVLYHAQEQDPKEVSCKEKVREIPKRSAEWYRMASDKLVVITKSLLPLRTHEHFKVRKELAVFCSRVLNECTLTMQPSQPIILDILISLCKDEHRAVAEYCAKSLNGYFQSASFPNKHRVMENMCENFHAMLNGLPKILNNIDSDRKISALNLLHGYVVIFCDEARPQRLTTVLSVLHNMRALTAALVIAVSCVPPQIVLTNPALRDVNKDPPTGSPWVQLRYLDTPAAEARFRQTCGLLATSEAAELLLDRLMELFHREKSAELALLMNWLMAASSSESFICRILETYLEEELWYLPLEVTHDEDTNPPDTRDLSVYNPRAWATDRVPGLYEGAVEVRYTGVSYTQPRAPAARGVSLGTARHNLLLVCLFTEGVGIAAERLGKNYQRYLLKTLCLILERVGSKYEMVKQAGLKSLWCVARSGGHSSVAELVRHNADYFTHKVTISLHKAWNSESALQILSVVMEYSDPSVLNCLYSIVNDVLVQSCDKYYERNLHAYLQVFLNFVDCVRKWFPVEECDQNVNKKQKLDITKELLDFINNSDEVERLLGEVQIDKESDKSAEEMYKEDMKNAEDNILDYDDKVTEEEPPLPQHISVTAAVLQRCSQFVGGGAAAGSALHTAARGLPLLPSSLLLPMVHRMWAPLAASFMEYDSVNLRHGLELLVTMASLSQDFIQSRCVKEVLPHIYTHLSKLSQESRKEPSTYCHSAGCRFQEAALQALTKLVPALGLKDRSLEDALRNVHVYLSSQQPKPLQALAVDFFVAMFEYDFGATWYHLRLICDNRNIIEPPPIKALKLEPIVGTPYIATNQDFNLSIISIYNRISNIK